MDDPLETFRAQFYDKLIKEEQQREQQQALLERTCFHQYKREIPSLLDGYRRFACDKCGRTTLRRANTLKHNPIKTAGESCTIS